MFSLISTTATHFAITLTKNMTEINISSKKNGRSMAIVRHNSVCDHQKALWNNDSQYLDATATLNSNKKNLHNFL